MGISERSKKVMERALAEEVVVLVWGPGPTDAAGHAKRRQILDALRDLLPKREVYFSEDPDLDKKLDTEGWPVPDKELLHLASCHLCVVLDTSKGSGEEIAHFADLYPDRLYVLTHEKFKGVTSFPASIRENLNQDFFSEDEFVSCGVVKRAVERARRTALKVYSQL